MRYLSIAVLILALVGCDSAGDTGEETPPLPDLVIRDGLEVTAIGKQYDARRPEVVISQMRANTGGNTSVRNNDVQHLVWKDQGYFQRNRDLGQVFTPQDDIVMDAIVLRTGPGDKAVLGGTPGAEVFVEFFEVRGEPRIHNNGTPPGTDATHGFTTNHRADDYIVGVEYVPYLVLTGGIFPDIPATYDGEREVNGDAGKFYFMRWRLTEPVAFEGGKQYAFMVGLQNPGPGYGFTLANDNRASSPAPPRIGGEGDSYGGGWALRREGNGETPNTAIGPEPQPGSELHQQLVDESLFGTGEARYTLSPTTDGYPDVDTYRDLQFAIEVR